MRDSGAYEFTGAINTLTLDKLINHRERATSDTAAQLLTGTRYRAEYKVTNNRPNRVYGVKVFEGGQLVCNLHALDPGESKQPYRCASNQVVLAGHNNVPANVTAEVSGTNQALANHTNAYYTGFSNVPDKLKVTHEGLNKAFGRAQGSNANVSASGFVNASKPTYFNVVLP